MRRLILLAAPTVLLAVAACSPAAPTPTPDGGNGGGGTAATPTASATDGNGGGNGGGSGDFDELAEQLAPPNSTQTARVDVEGGVSITYSTSDSVESLIAFYDQRLEDLGMQVFTSSTAGGGHSWVFGEGEGDAAGTVAITSAGGTTSVAVIVGGQ